MNARLSGWLLERKTRTGPRLDLVAPARHGGLLHLRGRFSATHIAWHFGYFGSGDVFPAALGQRHAFGSAPRLATAYTTPRGMFFRTYTEEGSPHWSEASAVVPNSSGAPALVSSAFGLWAYVPTALGGVLSLRYDELLQRWMRGDLLVSDLGQLSACAAIDRGGLISATELLVRAGQRLTYVHLRKRLLGMERQDRVVTDQASGEAAFVENHAGRLEAFLPSIAGGITCYTQSDDSPNAAWEETDQVAADGAYDAVSVLDVSDGPAAGQRLLAARIDDRIELFTRSSPTAAWENRGPIFRHRSVNPGDLGNWSTPHETSCVGIHTALLPSRRVLFFSLDERRWQPDLYGASCVVNPTDWTETVPEIKKNVFCSGHAFLPDGRLFVAGGHGFDLLDHHVEATHIFEPRGSSGTWHETISLEHGRWYPTCTTLPDGRIFIISGSHSTGKFEQENINATWTVFDPSDGSLSPPRPAPILKEAGEYALYPFVFVLPDQRLFIHAGRRSCFLRLRDWTFEPDRLTTLSSHPRNYPLQGTCVLLSLRPPEYTVRILLIGGGGTPRGDDRQASASCELLDLSEQTPQWREIDPMSNPRIMGDAVLLPNETVLVTNGSFSGRADHAVKPNRSTLVLDPETYTWTRLANARVHRLYHATALLLPDGRVMTGGTDGSYNPDPFAFPERRVEVFRPPYLFRESRPRITKAPETIRPGTVFTIETPDAAVVQTVTLIRATSVTHSFNMDQRCVCLEIRTRYEHRLELEAPPDSYVAPPGHYLLHVLDQTGVPSEAVIVRLGR